MGTGPKGSKNGRGKVKTWRRQKKRGIKGEKYHWGR